MLDLAGRPQERNASPTRALPLLLPLSGLFSVAELRLQSLSLSFERQLLNREVFGQGLWEERRADEPQVRRLRVDCVEADSYLFGWTCPHAIYGCCWRRFLFFFT